MWSRGSLTGVGDPLFGDATEETDGSRSVRYRGMHRARSGHTKEQNLSQRRKCPQNFRENFMILIYKIDLCQYNHKIADFNAIVGAIGNRPQMKGQSMKNFLKSIVIGLGGVAPGLSGSVLMIIFGLYQDTLHALGTLFLNRKDFGKNVAFLLPVISGMGVGVLIFSKVLDFFLNNFEVPTRFCFLGLILGTIPLFYREVRKHGFSNRYYAVMAAAAVFGTWFFTLNGDAFPQVSDPTFLQGIVIGVAVAASAIVPGIDPAVLLSTLGFYEAYVRALANLDFGLLLPIAVGLACGAVAVSLVMILLFQYCYTTTFSLVFGLFLSMIPNMLNEKCVLRMDVSSAVSVLLVVIGFAVSYYLGDMETNNRRLKKLFRR